MKSATAKSSVNKVSILRLKNLILNKPSKREKGSPIMEGRS
jgi:hypothetical protein